MAIWCLHLDEASFLELDYLCSLKRSNSMSYSARMRCAGSYCSNCFRRHLSSGCVFWKTASIWQPCDGIATLLASVCSIYSFIFIRLFTYSILYGSLLHILCISCSVGGPSRSIIFRNWSLVLMIAGFSSFKSFISPLASFWLSF